MGRTWTQTHDIAGGNVFGGRARGRQGSYEGSWEDHKHKSTTLLEDMSSGLEEGRDVQRMEGKPESYEGSWEEH